MEIQTNKNDDKYMVKRNILLRNYQVKLIKKAQCQNSIIHLPTGTGKTLIAINVLFSRSKDIKSGKKAFFVVPTKVLVSQTTKTLMALSKFKISYYTGDMNVDSWNKEKWESELNEYEVIVLTGEILRILLTLKFMPVKNISLVVFDECHHAVHNHPYSMIMNAIKNSNSSELPLILGLSATLLNSNPKKSVADLLEQLTTNLDAKILGAVETQEVIRFAASPTVYPIAYDIPEPSPSVTDILAVYDLIIENYKLLFYSTPDSKLCDKGDAQKQNHFAKASQLKNWLSNARLLLEELGVYGGSICALYYIVLIERTRLLSNNIGEIQAFICARTQLNMIRRLLAKVMQNNENEIYIYKYCSPKVQKFLDIVAEIYNRSKEDFTSTIVFVHRRITAIVLAFMFKRLKLCDERFKAIDAEFIVSSAFNIFNFAHTKNEDIVKRFSSKELNLLVATNILEEGIDVSSCNTIINFDFPLSYTSFVQSKGRGRDKTSIYYVFYPSNDFSKKMVLESYTKIEDSVNKIVCENVEDNEDVFEKSEISKNEEEFLNISLKSGDDLRIDGSTAIKCVYKYCASLPQDRFACLSPLFWYKKIGSGIKAFLELPLTSNVHETIEGDERSNLKLAKKSVFLKTVKILYELNEIDESLVLRKIDIERDQFRDLFPYYKHIDKDKYTSKLYPGTSQRKQVYNVMSPSCLTNSLPLLHEKTYLHVIEFSVTFDKPEIDRKVTLYNLLKNSCTYGLLTSKKLPKICQFPMFMDMGQIDCSLRVNFKEFILTSSELTEIKLFHFTLFKNVLRVTKPSQTLGSDFSYLIVPLACAKDSYYLNWEVIRSDFCQRNSSALVSYNPSSENARKQSITKQERNESGESSSEKSLIPRGVFDGWLLWNVLERQSVKPNFVLTEATYTNFVISPTYRPTEVPQFYVVSSVCYNMSPQTPFPREEYEDFFDYYKAKYNINIRNLEQPLLKVSILPTCSNYNRPKYDEKGVSRKYRTKAKEYQELLVPELCYVYPFLKTYWIKAMLIPTVLNRITHLYRIFDLRETLAFGTNLGVVVGHENVDWTPLEVEKWMLQENETGEPAIKNPAETLQKPQLVLPLSRLKEGKEGKGCSKEKKEEKENVRNIQFDLERNLFDIGVCDLEEYIASFIGNDFTQEFHDITLFKENEKMTKEALADNIQVPVLKLFSRKGREFGPELAFLLQACTSKAANDIINYERLEILGDSFLKFSVTFFLFKNYPKMNEGILTNIKGKLVGNRNLLDCGTVHNLASYINVYDLSPMSDWIPPFFSVPEPLLNKIVTENIDPVIMYEFEIPEAEQITGILSSKTLKHNIDILERKGTKYVDELSSPLLRRQLISDKTVADVVEALIGLYLLEFGLKGGFGIVNSFGILPRDSGSFSEVMQTPFNHFLFNNETLDTVELILSKVLVDELEAVLEYKFKNRGLLLEALTHPSYTMNRCTLCYQRLEFLGDAILDFLITTYLFENFENLSPGDVTDIRSALVNNITFASLSVRYEFHKYLLSTSTELMKCIEYFVKFQTERNHIVNDSVLILIEEENCLMAESVTVPKALGDIFESIAGAIFLDSGNSLETVWRVYYRLMKREIDQFTKEPPKPPVRILHEICGDKPYFEVEVINDLSNSVIVKCSVMYNNHEITTYGFGKNKLNGKTSAAKLALKKILELK